MTNKSFVELLGRALIVLVLLTTCGFSFFSHAKTLTLTIASREPISSQDGTGFLDQVVAEMFGRLGIDAEVVFYQSSARGIKNANDGMDDGVGLRIAGLEKKFDNLIRIPVPIIVNEFVAFSTKFSAPTENWHSLDDQEVTYILGWQIFEKNLTHHKHITRVKSNDQLFKMLKLGRTEFALHERWQGTWHSKRLGLEVNIHQPPLAKRKMYAYLHKRHAALVDKAASSLMEMKADGTYQKIVDTTLNNLLSRTR